MEAGMIDTKKNRGTHKEKEMGKSGMNEIEEDITKEAEMDEIKVREQDRKSKHKGNKDKGVKSSTRDVIKLLKWFVILAVVVILVVVGYKLARQLGWFGLKPKVETTILTSSQLEQVLQIDDLSVCAITYNGVAEVPQKMHPNKVAYYVSYEAVAKASLNMEDIKVQIDDNVGEGQPKKIIVTLPQLQVKQIDVDMASLDYMFVKKSANTADVSEEAYAACIADAGSECRGNEVFLQMAKENCENTVKALLMPIIENQDETYELVIQ